MSNEQDLNEKFLRNGAEKIISRFAAWEDVGRHGRGYYGSQDPVGRTDPAVWYHAYHEGFKFLQNDRQKKKKDWPEASMTMLDAILKHMGKMDIDPPIRALLAGSVLRYMAELD